MIANLCTSFRISYFTALINMMKVLTYRPMCRSCAPTVLPPLSQAAIFVLLLGTHIRSCFVET